MPESLPSAPGDPEIPPKRQKMYMKDSSLLSPSDNPPQWESRGLTREFSALHKFHKMRVQIEEIIEEEKKNLELHIKVDRETIKQFELALETSMWSPPEDIEAEAFADAEMSGIRSRMMEKLTNLLTENFGRADSSREDSGTEAEMELRAAEKILEVELAQMSEDQWIFQQFDPKDIIEVQSLHSERIVHANALEDDVQPAEDVIQTLRETPTENLVLEDQVISTQKRLDEPMMSLPEQLDELASSLQWNESRDSGTGSAAEANETSCSSLIPVDSIEDDGADALGLDFLEPLSKSCSKSINTEDSAREEEAVSPPCLQSKNEGLGAEKSCSDLWIRVADYYVQVSDPLFFQIDWQTRYRRQQDGYFICNECSLMKNGTIKMLDHIWVKHYGGRFKCPLCSDFATTRHNIGIHIKQNHPNAFNGKL